MSLKVEQVPNEPIIIATITGQITAPILHDMFTRSAALIEQMGVSEVWRVTDVSQIDIDVATLFGLLAEAAKTSVPGNSADPRFHPCIVGSNNLVKLYARAVKDKRYGELSLPVFTTIEQALAQTRSLIAAVKAPSSHQSGSRLAS